MLLEQLRWQKSLARDGLLEFRRWDARVTHVVAPELRRGAKTLGAMAAGNWLLSTSFLTASAAARCLVEPVRARAATPALHKAWVLVHSSCRTCVAGMHSQGWCKRALRLMCGLQDEHELDAHGLPTVSEAAPRHWRLRAQQGKILAFDSLRVRSA